MGENMEVSRCRGVKVSRCRGVEVSRCRGVEVSRCRGSEGTLSAILRVAQGPSSSGFNAEAPPNDEKQRSIEGEERGRSAHGP
jgi:hypothetical protein